MTMLKICFSLPKESAQTLFAQLNALEEPPFTAVTLIECDERPWFVEIYPVFLVMEDKITPQLLGLADFPKNVTASAACVEKIGDEDWVSRSQKGLSPVKAGRFFVAGSHDSARMKAHFYFIEIDARQAFGTAHHGTTYGCLVALEYLAQNRALPIHARILDVGTGSGILAIAAAKLFREPVLASDCDRVAVAIARENARLNKVGRQIEFQVGDGLDLGAIRTSKPYHLIIANILAAPLKSFAPAFAKKTAQGGFLLLSGLLVGQTHSIKARYRSFGFVEVARFPSADWMSLVLQKR